jgi:hypothetical protein
MNRLFRALTRWQRARTVALTLIIGIGLFTLRAPLGAVLTSLLPLVPPDPPYVAVDGSQCDDSYGAPLPVFANRGPVQPILEPRIESREGVWIGRDLLGTSAIEIAVDGDLERAEAEVIAWARSICDAQPRELHLVGFRDESIHDALARRLEHACPSFSVCTHRYL